MRMPPGLVKAITAPPFGAKLVAARCASAMISPSGLSPALLGTRDSVSVIEPAGRLQRIEAGDLSIDADIVALGYGFASASELARALGPSGIRVNAVAPGAVPGAGFKGSPALVEKIAELVKGGKIDGISGLQDESSRDGMRMVIECKRDSNPHKVLNNLFKHTALQMAFNANIVALVDGIITRPANGLAGPRHRPQPRRLADRQPASPHDPPTAKRSADAAVSAPHQRRA